MHRLAELECNSWQAPLAHCSALGSTVFQATFQRSQQHQLCRCKAGEHNMHRMCSATEPPPCTVVVPEVCSNQKHLIERKCKNAKPPPCMGIVYFLCRGIELLQPVSRTLQRLEHYNGVGCVQACPLVRNTSYNASAVRWCPTAAASVQRS